LIEQTSDVYIQAYKMITGKRFERDMTPEPLKAIREALKVYF
jgi:hypothetical protein